MPLIPAAIPAKPDQALKAVCFAMKNGTRIVPVAVSDAALEAIEPPAICGDSSFETFKRYRKRLERIASHKYELGRLEADGSIHIGCWDLT
jgi:hypothetical protein